MTTRFFARYRSACPAVVRNVRRSLLVGAVLITAMSWAATVHAQFGGAAFLGNRVVGGVIIDAEGAVQDVRAEDQAAVLDAMRRQIVGGKEEFAQAKGLRMVSLKGIQAAIQEAKDQGKPLAEEVLLLGGLTRVEYLFVDHENQDLILGGPSENWTVGKNGAIVGVESGRPIVYLDDLITAFRSVDAARSVGISCSIDPTPEGTQRLNAMLNQVRLAPGVNPVSLEPAMREAFGPQKVTLTGLSDTSHMARILFAADYQMKRIGMNLAKAPVDGLPSYLEMLRNRQVKSPQSRWWMACDYNAIEHSGDKLAWKLSGRGIKTLTEQEVVREDGSVAQTGKVEATAKKWADLFTAKLDELAVSAPVFGELRNVMDLCVVAALVRSQQLDQAAGCDLSVLTGDVSTAVTSTLTPPAVLPPQCSFVKTNQGWVVSASGGVLVDSWSVVSQLKVNDELATVQRSSKRTTSRHPWSW